MTSIVCAVRDAQVASIKWRKMSAQRSISFYIMVKLTFTARAGRFYMRHAKPAFIFITHASRQPLDLDYYLTPWKMVMS